MRRSVDQKIEILLKQIKSLQYDGITAAGQSARNPLHLEKLYNLTEEIKNADHELVRQKEELIFAYQTLEVAYQRYWEFFNYAPDGYLVTDTDGTIREANQTILSMLSLTHAQLIGQDVTRLIPELEQQGVGIQLGWFMSSQQLEVRLQPRDRASFFASLSIAPQYNVHNEPVGLLWLIRDISERKEMEEALQKSQSELGLILAQIPCVLWTTDTGFKITSASGTGLAAFHLSPDEIIGQNIQIYFSHLPDLALIEAHRRALSGNPQTCEFEWQDHIFQSIIKPLRDAKDQITGVIAVSFDITRRKQAEKTLQKSEWFNSSLLENSPNPILVIQADTSISYVNPAFEKLTGYSAAKIIGQRAPYPWWTEIDSRRSVESFKEALGRKVRRQEKQFKKKNGEKFWVELTSIWIKNEDEPGHHLQTWVNITEAKHLRENMEFYIMQITKIQEEERRRIAQELHEETLQSLAALCLATEAIIKSRSADPQDTIRNIRDLREKINGVIEEVRRFSYELRPGVLDYLGLTAALESLVDEINMTGIQAQLIISGKEKTLPPDMEITLFRIAQEACSNVKKHSQASKMSIDVYYTRNKIKLNISDNGRGFRLPGRLSDFANEGKLGLIGIEERARLYRGTFSLKTQPRRGAKISIILPMSAGAN